MKNHYRAFLYVGQRETPQARLRIDGREDFLIEIPEEYYQLVVNEGGIFPDSKPLPKDLEAVGIEMAKALDFHEISVGQYRVRDGFRFDEILKTEVQEVRLKHDDLVKLRKAIDGRLKHLAAGDRR